MDWYEYFCIDKSTKANHFLRWIISRLLIFTVKLVKLLKSTVNRTLKLITIFKTNINERTDKSHID